MVSAAGTQLELTTARFSESQFLAEEQRILDAYGNVVTQVAPTDAFDGLEVMVRPSESLTAAKATITSSMPVVFVTGRVQVPLNGRQGDTAPFYGGASTVGPGGECSSGFAVKKGTIKYMVTADHCGHTGISFPNFHTPPGIIVGHTYYYRYSLDSQAITGTDYASTMYSGCWTCTSTKAVSGAGNPVVGTVVCASGAYSGLVCDNLVSKYPVGGIIDGHAFSGFWQIRNQDGNGAGGFGDSGGPIYLPRSDGTAFVVGIVSSSPGESTDYGACQGLTTGRDCFQTVDIPGAGDILAWLGATVP